MRKRLPFISVVLCCYNGADVLPGALKALQTQKYGGRMEIIVVDDGSKDDTYKVAKSFKKVRVVTYEQNRGLAGARNAGIEAAKGDVVAFTDDDCRPLPTWLKELAIAYEDPEVLGAGGGVASTKPDNLVLRYLEESKPLRPLENSLAVSKKLSYRFGLYFKGLIGRLPQPKNLKRSIYSLVGANMSFRKSALLEVEMFDPNFRFGGEEEDVCKRINHLHPGSLVFMPKSKIKHQYERTLKDTLRRSKAYAKGNARMYYKHADVKPIIFPFPILIVLSTLLGILSPVLYLTPLILVPLIYFRWTMVAVKKRHLEAFSYSYIQMLQEWWANAGFVRGLWLYRNMYKRSVVVSSASAVKPIKRPKAKKKTADVLLTATKPLIFAALGALLAVFNLAELGHSTFQAILTTVCLALLPGYLLLSILRVRLHGAMSLVLAVTTSLASLILLSLALNTGISVLFTHPHFSTSLFVGGFDALCLALGVGAWLRTPSVKFEITAPERLKLSRPLMYMGFAGLPILGVIASNYLNRSGTNVISMIALVVAALVLLVTSIRFHKLRPATIAAVLYSVSLTLILMGSTRGAFLSGTDISKEYYLFTLTQHVGHWSPSLYNNAYNACLSINLLPVLFQSITKVSDQAIFRVVLPSIYALMPVSVFVFLRGRQKTTSLVAYLSTIFFMAQPVFMNWAAIPLRQMICLLLFAALMIVIFAKRELAQSARTILILLLGTGMILSHYSTTYLALGLLICAYLLNRVMYLVDVYVHHRQKGPIKPILGAPLIIVLCAVSWLWLTPITHTSSNITHLFDNAVTQIRDGHYDIFTSNQHANQSSLFDQFNLTAKPSTTAQVWNGYMSDATSKYQKLGVAPIATKTATTSTLAPASTVKAPDHIPHALASLVTLGGQGLAKLSHVFMAVGLVAIIVNVWKRRKTNHEFGIYSLSAVAILALVAVIPYASLAYDLGRTAQQMLLFLALPTITGGLLCLRKLSFGKLSERTSVLLLGIGLIFFLLFGTGWVSQLTGGTSPVSLLNNSGSQYGATVQPGEIAATDWLSTARASRYRVYAGYYARNRLWISGIVQPVSYDELLPWTIDRSAYVYEDSTELQTNRTVAYYNGSFVSYAYPTQLLTSSKNVIYSDGYATIYK